MGRNRNSNLIQSFAVLFLMLGLLFSLFLTGSSAEEAAPSKTEALSRLFTTADLMDATIEELQAAMESGRLTSVELTQMYLDRIAAYDKALRLNSIISINPAAMAQAAMADTSRAAGGEGLLLGIPILIKDNLDVAGMATTCGSSSRANAIADADSACVARLRAEGAVILGKTNMSQYAMYGYHSRSTIGGRVHNAYDLSRTPAGSSGGSAVAVTCNFCAAALGSDTGCSVRRPAGFANLYGLRPSYGLISTAGLYPLDKGKDTVGPICRTAEDLAILMDVLAGTDSTDKRTADADSLLPENGYRTAAAEGSLSGKRIGFLECSFKYQSIKPSSLMSNMIERAKDTFIREGAELADLSKILPDGTIYCISAYNGPSYRTRITEILEENKIDAVIYVSQLKLPQKEPVADNSTNSFAFYINIFGPLCGLPEIMVPMGVSDTDYNYPIALPVGLSIFAGYGKDADLIAIAAAFEKATDNRVLPQTVPTLPDEKLAAFAEDLADECRQLTATDYEKAGMAQVEKTLKSLQRLRMKSAEENAAETLGRTVNTDDTRIPVSAETYLIAVERLAKAYDGLKPVKAD